MVRNYGVPIDAADESMFAEYYALVRDYLGDKALEMAAFVRLGDTLVWVLPHDMSERERSRAQDYWAERVPGYRLVIVPRTVYIP